MTAFCDHCHQDVESTETVQTARATFSSPPESEEWCRACITADLEAAAWDEERASLKGYSDEERERI